MNAEAVLNNRMDVDEPADVSNLKQSYDRQVRSNADDASRQIIMSASGPFDILDCTGPFATHSASKSGKWSKVVFREHQILRTSLLEGVYVRTWECYMDMIRALIVRPFDTPYALAPFLFDICLHEDFPTTPP